MREGDDGMKYLMGIDMGGTMVKTSIYDLEGSEIATHGEHISILHPRYDRMERDLTEARDKMILTVRKAISKAHISGSDILGIGVTGQGNGAYMFDADGNPVCNGIMSSDMRAKNYIKKWYSDGTFDAVYPLTGSQIWAGNISALIAWFQDHEPDILEKTAYIVTAKDYVRYLLTGEFHTEITEGSGTSCMELSTRQYSPEIFEKLGISAHLSKIPPAIGSCEIGGYVTAKAAALTGLKEGTPVVGGEFDVSASTAAAGVIKEHQMGIVVGSWGINTILQHKAVHDPELFMQYVYVIPDYIALMEGSATSTANLEWFIDTCMERGEDIYKRCNDLVQAAPYRDSLLFLPYIYSSNVHLDAKAMFVGLHGGHELKHMLRAVFEGVVFCHRLHIDKLLKHDKMPSRIQMAGGATRSDVWMQLFADILGAEIEVSQASELGTMSVALCAGIGCGVFDSIEETTLKWAKSKRVFYPDQEKHLYYQKKYHAFKTVISAMDSAWSELDELIEA